METSDEHARLNHGLAFAAQIGDVAGLESMLSLGADPASKPGSRSVLELAIVNGHAPIVSALAQRGIDLNHFDGVVGTPLSMAAGLGHEACVEALLSAGANPNAAESLAGWTPLMRAAEAGQLGCMLVLIDAGAAWDAKRAGSRDTAKSVAVAKGRSECVALLESLELRQDIGRDQTSATPGSGPRL